MAARGYLITFEPAVYTWNVKLLPLQCSIHVVRHRIDAVLLRLVGFTASIRAGCRMSAAYEHCED